MRRIEFQLAALLSIFICSPLPAQEAQRGGGATVNGGATQQVSWIERDTLTGDWGGHRTSLKERGITLAPRLTQFYQGALAGGGNRGFQYGGKLDLMLNADLSRMGFWDGFSLTIHGEYNYGWSMNGVGGVVSPPNTALLFPGLAGADRFDLSSVYVQQRFGNSVSLSFGKFNMIDLAGMRPFSGGAGIDSFWNLTFVAPPSGAIPPYLFGALVSVRTEPATFGFWVYDPVSVVNKSGFEAPFADGVSFRGSVDFPVTIGGLPGRQGFSALFSTQPGIDQNSIGDTLIPPFPRNRPDIINNSRYHLSYSFDQYLYRRNGDPKEGFGLFGQFGISDGNPNNLYFSALAGLGGTGLIPGRSRDNWGIAYYYNAPSRDLMSALSPRLRIKDEQGLEAFYNFRATPWFTVGADLQVIAPTLEKDTAVFLGFRNVIRF